MNAYNERENQGRDKWLNLNKKDVLNGEKTISFSKDPFCAWDFEMTSATLSRGEIKDIHRPYSNYPDFQIDAMKIKKLAAACMEDDRTPYLVAFFTDYTMVWDVSKIDWTTRARPVECTSTTASNYNHGQKTKLETYFTKEEAIYVKEN